MTFGANNFYYDKDGVIYICDGVQSHYTFEQGASIIEDVLAMNQVPSPLANVIVAATLEYADPDTPSDVRARLEEWRVASVKDQDKEAHSC